MLAAIFIAVTFYQFVKILLDSTMERKKYVYAAIFIYAVVSFCTDLILKDPIPMPELNLKMMNQAGLLYPLVVLVFTYYIIAGIFLLSRNIPLVSKIQKIQFKYIIAAIILAVITGSTNFLIAYKIQVYPINPFAPYLQFLYPVIIGYAIVQHKLMDIETVIHKTLAWAVTSSTAIIPIYIFAKLLESKITILNATSVTILAFIIIIFYTFFLKYIQPNIDHKFQRKMYDMQNVLRQLTNNILVFKTLNDLVSKVLDTITETLYLDKSTLLLLNEETGNYNCAKMFGIEKEIRIPKGNEFISYILKNSNICELDIIESTPEYEDIKSAAKDYFKIVQATVCIPLVYNNELLGLINLGKKKNLKSFSSMDIDFLTSVKSEATIALSNSLSFDKIEKQNEALKKLDKLKSEVLSTTSHELKTPINQIKGLTQNIIAEVQEKYDDKGLVDDLMEVMESNDELNKKVTDILETSKLASGKKVYTFEDVNLKTVVDMSIIYNQKSLDMSRKNRKVKLITDIPDDFGYIYGDKKSIHTVIDNLIRNAVKFTEKGEIKVSAKLLKKNDTNNLDNVHEIVSEYDTNNFVLVSITDTGAGIEKQFHRMIFEQFRQADSSFSRGYEGTGLGLYICKKIIDDHFGHIWVESESGKGSTFNFVIPLERVTVDRRAGDDRREGRDRRLKEELENEQRKIVMENDGAEIILKPEHKTIERGNGEIVLVVDDNPRNVVFIKKMLENYGYKVLEAYNGSDAFDILERNYNTTKKEGRIEIVLTDLMMPGVTGYDLCKCMKDTLIFRYIPIIMITVMDDYKYNVYGYNLGADDYITKPFEREILLSKVRQLLNNYQIRRKISSILTIGKEITGKLINKQKIQKLFELSLSIIKKVIFAEKITIMLKETDDNGNEFLKVSKNIGVEYADFETELVKKGEGISGYVWDTMSPVFIKNISEDDRFKGKLNKRMYETDDCLITPIIFGDDFLGVVCVTDKVNQKEFTYDDLNFLNIISDQIATAIKTSNFLEELEKRNQLEFMTDVADWVGHEVLTPAQSISVVAETILLSMEDSPTLDIVELEENLELIPKQCERIKIICTIIMGFGKKGLEMKSLKVCELQNNIKEIAKTSLFGHEKRGVKIEIETDDENVHIMGDMGMLEFTIFNMVKNAERSVMKRRKTEKDLNGLITISQKIKGDYVVIIIEDNGVGIEKEDIYNVFHRNFSSSPDGRGIGLFLSKTVIEGHKGMIEVISKINNYTRMIISIPLYKEKDCKLQVAGN